MGYKRQRLSRTGASWAPVRADVLERLGATHPDVHWDRLLFSAKESVYKEWFPLTGRWLDFGECAITPDPERGTFTAVLKVPGPWWAGCA